MKDVVVLCVILVIICLVFAAELLAQRKLKNLKQARIERDTVQNKSCSQ